QRGNTLSEIAFKYGTTVNEIAGLNGIRNPNLIFVGEKLKIDVTRNLDDITSISYDINHLIYTIKHGNTLTYIANKFGVSINSIVKLNHIKNPNLIFAGERLRINN
ncbi:MAG: LysM peptidoglycan-binding domain-containing protein, partial [Clostridia bacterium]|nr:LysM peptidoglycan-binding domain-containing protein [Clostridia bacterium]